MKITTIEEGIYNIKTRESIKKAIFTFDGEKVTRQLIIQDDYPYRNNKIDVINTLNFQVKMLIPDVFNVDYDEILNTIKKNVETTKELSKDCYERCINDELPGFKNPKITKN